MASVRTEVRGHLLEVTLDRPKANAIDSATSRDLGEAFAAFRDDDGLRVAIVTGGGERFFSAGWDMKAAVAGDPEDWGPGGFAGLTELFDLEKPVIAAVNGLAVGGGFELALACDLIVASSDAEFFLPEVNLGFVPDAGGVLRLPKRLPRAVAVELLLTGRRMGADEAARWGVVNRVSEPGRALEEARALAEPILAAAPMAVRAIKAILRATDELSVQQGYRALRDASIPAYDAVMASEDADEGPRAFAEGRPPVWRDR
ncbi:MAG: enoyl-CoA hydratase-related protein [Actinomycetota bacterium]